MAPQSDGFDFNRPWGRIRDAFNCAATLSWRGQKLPVRRFCFATLLLEESHLRLYTEKT